MSTDTTAGTLAKPGKYLSFVLGREEYGLEILKVQEIIGIMDVTRVPRTPAYVRGVINLRGRVIPVVDLRSKFQMPTVEDTEKTCVIVVQVNRGDLTVTMGVIVDEVSEVLSFTQEQIEPAPCFGGGMDEADYIIGMGKLGKKVVILLDGDRVLQGEELDAVAEATQ
jgi:purine-binding chemotaxis protein CheW